MGADETEIWRPVVGWEGRYEVSNMGRVRSTPAVRGGGKVLSPSFMKGYPKIIFTDGKRRETFQIHRLVLLAFVGPPPAGFEAAHLNGVRDDARLSNLRWVTRKENAGHKNAHGTMQRGDTHSTSILTSEAVRYIRGNLNNKSFAEMGRELGVSEATVANAAKGEKWRHIFCTECDRLSKELETERAKSALLAGRVEELETGAKEAREQAYDMFGWLNFEPRGLCICHEIREADHRNVDVDWESGKEDFVEPPEHCFECDEYVTLHRTLKRLSPAPGTALRAPTAPREAAGVDSCRVCHELGSSSECWGLHPLPRATPTESTGAKCEHPTVSGHCCICNRCDNEGTTPTSEECK